MVGYKNRWDRLRQERGDDVARAYQSWAGMRHRARRADPKRRCGCYAGISVDPRWDDFEVFLADMGVPPKGMSIDRIDAAKDYTPKNCRWATATTQSRNRSYAKLSEHDATDVRWLYTQGLSQQKIADEYGVTQRMISKVVRNEAWV